MEQNGHQANNWQQCETNFFWREIASREHVVQIYENEIVFMDLLESYVVDGFNAGDCVILILSPEHRQQLYQRLYARNLSLNEMISSHRFIALDAMQTLAKFMVDGWPDETLFTKVVSELLISARHNKRPVRAFGEMVAILWEQGHSGATMQLERLWNRFCEKESFTLFCAYPRSGFHEHANNSMMHICGKHTKMVTSTQHSKSNLQYRNGMLRAV
jgi:hypothetical protein